MSRARLVETPSRISSSSVQNVPSSIRQSASARNGLKCGSISPSPGA